MAQMMPIEGAYSLLKNLQTLNDKAIKAVASAGLRKEAQETAKVVKADIPSRYKDARKAIGWRFSKGKKAWTGHIFAKAGTGVGFRKGTKRRAAAFATKDRNGRKGVGIGVPNIHWFYTGTDHRFTGTKRKGKHKKGNKTRVFTGGAVRYTGKMRPIFTPVAASAAKNRSRLKAAFYQGAKRKFDTETAQLRVKA